MFIVKYKQLHVFEKETSSELYRQIRAHVVKQYPTLEYDEAEFEQLIELFQIDELAYGLELFERYIQLGAEVIKEQYKQVRQQMNKQSSLVINEAVRLNLNSLSYTHG